MDFYISNVLPGFIIFFLLTNANNDETDDGLIFLIQLHSWSPGWLRTIPEKHTLPRVCFFGAEMSVCKALCEFPDSEDVNHDCQLQFFGDRFLSYSAGFSLTVRPEPDARWERAVHLDTFIKDMVDT